MFAKLNLIKFRVCHAVYVAAKQGYLQKTTYTEFGNQWQVIKDEVGK